MSTSIVFGSKVKLHYRISAEDGTVLEDNFTNGETPLELVIGDGTLPEGIELMLYGLKLGDRDTRTLTPLQAWGQAKPEKITTLPLGHFPEDTEVHVGLIVEFETAEDFVLGKVLSINGEDVEVDFNHSLAGKTIQFEAEIIDIQTGTH